jgi:hypothetical protein
MSGSLEGDYGERGVKNLSVSSSSEIYFDLRMAIEC